MTRITRRQFLGATTGAAACLALPWPDALAAPKKGARMRLGLVTYLWGRDWNLPTLIANCEKSEVLGVELRTTHKHGVEPKLNKKQRAEVRKRFEDSPVICLGPGSNERFDSPDAGALKRAIDATKAFLHLSHDIGGSGVKVKPNQFHRNVPREKTIAQIGKALADLARFGADLGQQVRLEVHGRETSLLPNIKAIMDAADHPGAVVCWNSNSQDLAGKGLDHNFHLVKDRFGQTVHVRELNIGKYPYARLMELFVAMDYDGWILLEARTKPKDRVAAMIEQRKVFARMVADAQAK